jgi:mycothiol synthase
MVLLEMKMITIIIKPMVSLVNPSDPQSIRRVCRFSMNLSKAENFETLSCDGFELRGFKVAQDEELLLRLNNEIFNEHPDQGNWSLGKLMTKLNETLRAEEDVQFLVYRDEPAGFVWFKHHKLLDSAPCEIYVLGVLERFRGVGLGSYLVASSLNRMLSMGCDVAWVYTDDSNSVAKSLYESFGFRLDLIEEL